jgi:hypothetical protein
MFQWKAKHGVCDKGIWGDAENCEGQPSREQWITVHNIWSEADCVPFGVPIDRVVVTSNREH